jgi:penicillin-binding protein 1C
VTRLDRLGLFAAALILAIGSAAIAVHVRDVAALLPEPPAPSDVATSTVVLDRDGLLLRPFTIADGRWRLPVTRADVDQRYLEFLIAYEDGRFAEHGGVDWKAMARAAGQFVLAGGRIVSGGSTLTMQVARLIEGGRTRDADAKLRQVLMAGRLEERFTKDEILTLYLMLAPFGGNIEGVRAASLAYFGKEPTRLTVAEAALLVALPQSPEARRPDRDPDAARAARDRVIDRLVSAGVLGTEEAEAAKTERVPTRRRDFPMLAAHMTERALAAQPGAGSIRLTLDRTLQASIEALARDRAATFGPRLSMAIVVADHMSGAILASVGSPGLLEDQRAGHVDMTLAVRSPGSTLKPLIYGLAFEEGLAHPSSLIEDRPTAFGGYAPQNFDGHFRGTVTIREALVESLNIPAIVTLDAVGPVRLVARLKRAGVMPTLPALSSPGLAVGLGGVGMSLRDLVQLYVAIARGGDAIVLRDGVVDRPAPRPGPPVLERDAAWQVSDILAAVPPPNNASPGLVAYKTGTSYGYRDAWAIGFDGRHVVGVWIGRPDGTAVPGLSGITGAAPVLFEAFSRIGPRRAPLTAQPPGVLVAKTAELPPPLRRFRHPDDKVVVRDTGPEIAYPLQGVTVDLGIRAGDPSPLVIKVRNGAPPFTFYANGVPVGRSPFARAETWQPDGSGFVTLSVVDGTGRSDRVTVFVE